jgi:hypothetical protein
MGQYRDERGSLDFTLRLCCECVCLLRLRLRLIFVCGSTDWLVPCGFASPWRGVLGFLGEVLF